MRSEYPAHYENVQFLFITFPCIGETVLRGKVVKFKDNKQTELFRDKQLLIDLVLSLRRPTVVAEELTSPHANAFKHHLLREETMKNIGYSQTQCSAVVNACLFGDYTSQPRWIRIWVERGRSDITNFDTRRYDPKKTISPRDLNH